jgi:ankyrin repeat protein
MMKVERPCISYKKIIKIKKKENGMHINNHYQLFVLLTLVLFLSNGQAVGPTQWGQRPAFKQGRVNGNTQALFEALKADDLNIGAMRQLIDAGVDTKGRGEFGNTPLHLAAERGSVEIVQALLRAGAIVNANNRYGRTPLHLAVCEGHVAIVKILLKAKANVDAKDHNGETPLDWAIEKDYEEIRSLLEKRMN